MIFVFAHLALAAAYFAPMIVCALVAWWLSRRTPDPPAHEDGGSCPMCDDDTAW